MKLKEKFENIIFNYIGSEWDRRDVSINLEKDTDDYAIGFAEWKDKISSSDLLYSSKYAKSNKELLEIYKKEKGL